MGATRNVTRVAIQGRPHHNEFVSEFSISYGYNGLDYADFKEPGGNTKVKKIIMQQISNWIKGKGSKLSKLTSAIRDFELISRLFTSHQTIKHRC